MSNVWPPTPSAPNAQAAPVATRAATAADTALLIVRLAVALPFIFHGAQLAFVAFGGPGLAGFAKMGHQPLPVAALIAYGEFLGGLGVLFGVLTRPASTGILIIMLGAIVLVHLPHGYDSQKQGFEYPLTHVFLTIALLIAGPGAYAAWSLIGRPRPDKPILQ